MIGCRAQNNDFYVFFDKGEIRLSGRKKVVGTFVNLKNPRVEGVLESLVDDSIKDLITTSAKTDDQGSILNINLRLKKRVYEKLMKKGFYESHESYRHVNLIDVERMDLVNINNTVLYGYLLNLIDGNRL